MPSGKVLLAALPFAPVNYPSMALGLLKPAVERLGVACDIRYFSLDYLDHVGVEAFQRLDDPSHYGALAGEWVFAARGAWRCRSRGSGLFQRGVLPRGAG